MFRYFRTMFISLALPELHHVELWGGRNGQHPLEGTSSSPAGLPHLRVSPHGAHLHQVPT